jgi:UDP-glucuronate decarboxylase
VDGTMNVLEVAAANGARVVVGDAAERWGEGVRCAESLAIDFARIRGIDVRFVRLASVYGPRMAPDGDHIVSSMVLQALRGEDLAPRMRLDRRVRLAFVDDIVEALMLTMNSDQRASTVVAPSSEASVLDLAKMIAEAAGLSGLAVTDGSSDAPPSMPTSGRLMPMLDALSASTAVGLTPSVQLTEGLERTVQWFAARTTDRRQGRTSRTSGIYARDPARAPVRDTIPDEAPATLRTG